jgi:hypothetical protein
MVKAPAQDSPLLDRKNESPEESHLHPVLPQMSSRKGARAGRGVERGTKIDIVDRNT